MMMMMTMKRSFSGPFVIVLLLSSTVCGLGSVVSKQYTHFNSHITWQEAQNYCKSNYAGDLATVYTQSDENLMTMANYHAWIGLSRATTSYTTSYNYSSYWKWSNGVYLYFNAWGNSEPHTSENCATVHYTHRKFYGAHCGGTFFFICHEQHPNHYEYKFIPQSKSRSEALQYCKSVYDDLATFRYSYDLNSAVIDRDFPVWIGLYREGGTWRWSTGLSEYRNWDSNEPGNNGNCVSISSKGKKMATQDCSNRFPFICSRDNLVLVKENKTWEEAMEHCRALHYQLISVQPGQDHDYVTTKVMEAYTEEVWSGLRFLAGEWLWVNGASMSYSDLPLCPPLRQHCGTISKNNTGSMEIADCIEKRNFLCYK